MKTKSNKYVCQSRVHVTKSLDVPVEFSSASDFEDDLCRAAIKELKKEFPVTKTIDEWTWESDGLLIEVEVGVHMMETV